MEIQTEQPPSLLLSLGNQKIGRINHLLSVTIFAMKVLIEQEYIIKLQTRWQTDQVSVVGSKAVGKLVIHPVAVKL